MCLTMDKPESRAALLARTRLVHAIKPLEHAVERFGRNARPVVLHKNFQFAVVQFFAADGDRALRAAIFDGVVHEVGEDLFEPVRVRHRGEFGQFVDELHVCVFGAGFKSAKTFSTSGRSSTGCRFNFIRPDSSAEIVEQILDEQIQPLGVALDDFQKALGDFGIVARAVEQRLDVALDERERRAQFVADVGDKFLARAFELFEPRQVVENQNRAFAFAGGIGDDGGVDLQPAFAQLRQLEFVIKNLSLGLDALRPVQPVRAGAALP